MVRVCLQTFFEILESLCGFALFCQCNTEIIEIFDITRVNPDRSFKTEGCLL